MTIDGVGAKLVYLPAYSPDFNPIELMWSKIKAYLRKVKARTSENLFNFIAQAFDTINTSDIKSWYLYDDYYLPFGSFFVIFYYSNYYL